MASAHAWFSNAAWKFTEKPVGAQMATGALPGEASIVSARQSEPGTSNCPTLQVIAVNSGERPPKFAPTTSEARKYPVPRRSREPWPM